MNKSDLVSKLTARLDGDRRAAVAAVNGVLEEIEQSLARGEKVSLLGFGTFDRRERGPRTARNPATGATVQVGASVAPVFRAGAGLKQLLSEAARTAEGTALAAVARSASAVTTVPAAAATVLAPATKAAKKAAKKVEAKAPKKAAKKVGAKAATKPPKGRPAASKKSGKAAAAGGGNKSSGKTPTKG